MAFRFDPPDPPDNKAVTEISDRTATLLHRNQLTSAIVIGYGPGTLVTPVIDVTRVVLAREGVRVHDLLRADLARHACSGCIVASASLLAFTAWQAGDGALANLAIDRALADDPGYSMARLTRAALTEGLLPSAAVLSMTPEEFAASYQVQRCCDQ